MPPAAAAAAPVVAQAAGDAAKAVPELIKVISSETREWASWGVARWIDTHQTEMTAQGFQAQEAVPDQAAVDAVLASAGYKFERFVLDEDQTDSSHVFNIGTDKSSAKMGLMFSWEWWSMNIVPTDPQLAEDPRTHIRCGAFIRNFRMVLRGAHVPSGYKFQVTPVAENPPRSEVVDGVGMVHVGLEFRLGRIRGDKNTLSDGKTLDYKIDGRGRITWVPAAGSAKVTANFENLENLDTDEIRDLMDESNKGVLASISAKERPTKVWACQSGRMLIVGTHGESVRKFFETNEKYKDDITRGDLKYVPPGGLHPNGQWAISLDNTAAGDWIKSHLKEITGTKKNISIKKK